MPYTVPGREPRLRSQRTGLGGNAPYPLLAIRHTHDQRKAQTIDRPLVRVVSGEVFDVAVDLRPDSPTYGKWEGAVLSAENRRQFFVPRGFAHGFLVLSDVAEFCYKCDDVYHPNDEGGLMWNDPEIGIEWPILEGMELVLSEKDKAHPGLKDLA